MLRKYLSYLLLILFLSGCGGNDGSNVIVTTPNAPNTPNAAPIVKDIKITNIAAKANVGDKLTGGYSYSDAENDKEAATTFRWLRNGLVINGANTLEYIVQNEDQGGLITFEVTPIAATGTTKGLAVVSNSIEVISIAENLLEKVKSAINDDTVPVTTKEQFDASGYAKKHLSPDESERLNRAHNLVASAVDPDPEWFSTKVDRNVIVSKAGESHLVQLTKEDVDGTDLGPVSNDNLRLIVRIQRGDDSFEQVSQNDIAKYAQWSGAGRLYITVPSDLDFGRLLVGIRPNFNDEATNAIAERWSAVVIAEVWRTKSDVITLDTASVLFPIDNAATSGFAPTSKFTRQEVGGAIKKELSENKNLFLPLIIENKKIEINQLISFRFKGVPYSGRVVNVVEREGQQFLLLAPEFYSIYDIMGGDSGFIIQQGVYPEHVIFREGDAITFDNENTTIQSARYVSGVGESIRNFFKEKCSVGKTNLTFEAKFTLSPLDIGLSTALHTAGNNVECVWESTIKEFRYPISRLIAGAAPAALVAELFGAEVKASFGGKFIAEAESAPLFGVEAGYFLREGASFKVSSLIGALFDSRNLKAPAATGKGEIGYGPQLSLALNFVSKNGVIGEVLSWVSDEELAELGLEAKASIITSLAANLSNASEVKSSDDSSMFGLESKAAIEVSPSEAIVNFLEDNFKTEVEFTAEQDIPLFDGLKVEAEHVFTGLDDNGEGKASINGLQLTQDFLKDLLPDSKGVLSGDKESIFNDPSENINYAVEDCQIKSPVIGCSGMFCGTVDKEVELCQGSLAISSLGSLSGNLGESKTQDALQITNDGKTSANYILEWLKEGTISDKVSLSAMSGVLQPRSPQTISASFTCPAKGSWSGEIGIRRPSGEKPGNLASVNLVCDCADCCGKCCAEGETPPPCGCPTEGSLPPLCCGSNSGSCSDQGGDPHLRTFDGLAYSFQAVGEFILTKSILPNDTFEVQTRYRPWGSRVDVSVAQAVAVKVDQDRVGYYSGLEPPLKINGVAKDLPKGESMSLPSGGKVEHVGSTYRITGTDNSAVDIRYSTVDMFIAIRVPPIKQGKVIGLFGNADNNIANDLTLRDGTVLGTQLSFEQLYPTYADSWRVKQGESLFDYQSGETTETFTDRNFPRIQTTIDGLAADVRANAERICKAKGITDTILLNNCILDVALTGEAGFAETHENAEVPTTTIEVTPPPPPTINDVGFGKLTGSLVNVLTDQDLTSGQVDLSINGYPLSGNNSHAVSLSGRYETAVLPIGSGYRLDIQSEGYIAERVSNLTVLDRLLKEIQVVELVPISHSGLGHISGVIKNALNNTEVANLNIHARRYINQRSGDLVQRTVTNQNGVFSFSDLPAGNYTFEVEGNGYVTNYINAISIGGETRNVVGVVSPTLGDSVFRVVLTWGSSPSDLDTHLTGPDGLGDRFHIFHGHEGNPDITVSPYAYLDRDETMGFGPETMTIGRLINTDANSIYRYSIHDYSNAGSTTSRALGESGARVDVYGNGNRLITTLNVPVQPGTLWTVFEIDVYGNIKLVNKMSYEVAAEDSVSAMGAQTQHRQSDQLITDYWRILFQSKKD